MLTGTIAANGRADAWMSIANNGAIGFGA